MPRKTWTREYRWTTRDGSIKKLCTNPHRSMEFDHVVIDLEKSLGGPRLWKKDYTFQ